MASVSAGHDCPYEAPDSLQISWTSRATRRTGCSTRRSAAAWRIGIPTPRIARSGAVPARAAARKARASCSVRARSGDRPFRGTFANGKREGFGRYAWAPRVSYEGLYADDGAQRLGHRDAARRELLRHWNNGCLTREGPCRGDRRRAQLLRQVGPDRTQGRPVAVRRHWLVSLKNRAEARGRASPRQAELARRRSKSAK
jgi:hypothetical protein